MKRTILAVLVGLLLGAGTASAQYSYGQPPYPYPYPSGPTYGNKPYPAPGYNPNVAGTTWEKAAYNGEVSGGRSPCPPGGGNGGGQQQFGQRGVLGPWYLYWPYEAHFFTPAHPQFPYWPSPQTLYGPQTDAVPPIYARPSYGK